MRQIVCEEGIMGALLQTKKRLYTVKEKIKQFNKAHIRKRIALLKKDIYFHRRDLPPG